MVVKDRQYWVRQFGIGWVGIRSIWQRPQKACEQAGVDPDVQVRIDVRFRLGYSARANALGL